MAEAHIKNLGEKPSRTRESMGLTLQEFADIVSVVPSTIQKIETGAMTP